MAPISTNSVKSTSIPFKQLAQEANKKAATINFSAGDSISDSVENLDDCKEMTLLREKIVEIENNYNNLLLENKKSNIELAHEKHKVSQLKRTLQFVKDNQETLKKLKEAYMTIKYNEPSETKIVEIQEKSVQTSDELLCKCCLNNENVQNQLQERRIQVEDCILVTKNEMEQLTKTVASLKEAIFKWDKPSNRRKFIEESIAKDDSGSNGDFVI